MVTPIFKFVDETHIVILDKDTGTNIGTIETPAATIAGKEQAIQVCGFDYAVDLWGCGCYTNSKGNQSKKDIQLLWTDIGKANTSSNDGLDNCSKCYSKPCKCEELRIYKSGEYILEKL